MLRLKKTTFVILSILFILAAFTEESWSSPQLQITVQTNKGSYTIEEDIILYGYVKLDDKPVNNASVAVEIRDPAATPVMVRTLSTNSSGMYSTVFKLSSETPTGTYTVNASCSIGSNKATSTTSFVLERVSSLTITVYMGKSTYKAGDTVTMFGEVKQGGTSLIGVLVAVEVEDSQKTPVVMRVLETDNHGVYSLTFQLPPTCPTGTYTVHVSTTFEGQNAASTTTFNVNQELSADVNQDGTVNTIDLTLIALAWGSYPGHPRWDERCDLDGNKIINIIDITLAAREYAP